MQGTGNGLVGRELEAFSDCVGAIYDCAIDPGAWPAALERVCGLMDGMNGGVIMADPREGMEATLDALTPG